MPFPAVIGPGSRRYGYDFPGPPAPPSFVYHLPVQTPSYTPLVPCLEGAGLNQGGGFDVDEPKVLLITSLASGTTPGGATPVGGVTNLYTGRPGDIPALGPYVCTIVACEGTYNIQGQIRPGSHCSIWGQFAPGGGMIWRGSIIQAVILFGSQHGNYMDFQHLDFRPGDDGTGSDADSGFTDGAAWGGYDYTGATGTGPIHALSCSFAWSRDELCDAYVGNPNSELGFTLCMFAKALDKSNGRDTLSDPIGRHPFGPIMGQGKYWGAVSFQYCGFASIQDRMPSVATLKLNYVNNLIYDPGNTTNDTAIGLRITHDYDASGGPTSTPMEANIVGNLICKGPSSAATFSPFYIPAEAPPAGSTAYISGNASFQFTYSSQSNMLSGSPPTGYVQGSVRTNAYRSGWGTNFSLTISIGTGPNPNDYTTPEMRAFAAKLQLYIGPRPLMRGSGDLAGRVAQNCVNRIDGTTPQGGAVNSPAGVVDPAGWPDDTKRFSPNDGGYPILGSAVVDWASPGAAWHAPLPTFNGKPDNRLLASGVFSNGQSKAGFRTLQAFAYEQHLYVTGLAT